MTLPTRKRREKKIFAEVKKEKKRGKGEEGGGKDDKAFSENRRTETVKNGRERETGKRAGKSEGKGCGTVLGLESLPCKI